MSSAAIDDAIKKAEAEAERAKAAMAKASKIALLQKSLLTEPISSGSDRLQPLIPEVAHLAGLLGTTTPRQTLLAAAKIYLNLMSATRHVWRDERAPYLNTPLGQSKKLHDTYLQHAGERYLAFQQLRRTHAHTDIVPTLDIAAVWAGRLKQPAQHTKGDETNAYADPTAWYRHARCLLLTSGSHHIRWRRRQQRRIAGWCAALASCVSGTGGGAGLAAWRKARAATHVLWATEVGGQYESGGGSDGREGTQPYDQLPVMPLRPEARSALREEGAPSVAELAVAVTSQVGFVQKMLRLGPDQLDDAFLAHAVERYGCFLALAREAPPSVCLVPPLDVDLIWHAHMLSPVDYVADCRALLGRALKHDATLAEGTLGGARSETKWRWDSTRFEGRPGGQPLPGPYDRLAELTRRRPPMLSVQESAADYYGGFERDGWFVERDGWFVEEGPSHRERVARRSQGHGQKQSRHAQRRDDAGGCGSADLGGGGGWWGGGAAGGGGHGSAEGDGGADCGADCGGGCGGCGD